MINLNAFFGNEINRSNAKSIFKIKDGGQLDRTPTDNMLPAHAKSNNTFCDSLTMGKSSLAANLRNFVPELVLQQPQFEEGASGEGLHATLLNLRSTERF